MLKMRISDIENHAIFDSIFILIWKRLVDQL